ncbi:MAG: phosphoribosyltransferase [Truepera sp.]|nr:phosphoribosyltransferase [Truepera sp.]
MQRFKDRREAGKLLAKALYSYQGREDVLVLALPRGGVPVAFEVASALGAPLELLIVRKLGVPGHEELALGAIASGNVRVLNQEVMAALGIRPETVEAVAAREALELARREQLYRGSRPMLPVAGQLAIVIDDGIATGATMRAAVRALRQLGAARVLVATPTSARDSAEMLRHEADEVVCLATPEPYHAVGLWYEQFEQISDNEVRQLLELAVRHSRKSHEA